MKEITNEIRLTILNNLSYCPSHSLNSQPITFCSYIVAIVASKTFVTPIVHLLVSVLGHRNPCHIQPTFGAGVFCCVFPVRVTVSASAPHLNNASFNEPVVRHLNDIRNFGWIIVMSTIGHCVIIVVACTTSYSTSSNRI